jgi:hypothetical protein
MDPFEHELANGLRKAATTTNVRPGSLAKARTRARSLQMRRRRGSVAAGVLALSAVTIGVAVVVSDGDRGVVEVRGAADDSFTGQSESQDSAADTSTSTQVSAPAAQPRGGLAPSPFTWAPVAGGLPISNAAPVTRDLATGALYGIGTQPGSSPGAIDSVPMKSTDGVTWTPLGTVANTAYMRNLSVYDGALYSVGTAAITAPIKDAEDWGDIVTRTSTNGTDWSTDLLPGIDVRAIRKKYGAGFSQTFDVVSGPAGTLFAQQVASFFDPTRFDLGEVDATLGVETVDGGIVAYGAPCTDESAKYTDEGMCELPDGTIVESDPALFRTRQTMIPWAELGVTDEDIDVFTGRPRFFLSTSGGEFVEVQFPTTAGNYTESIKLAADAEGFAAVVKTRKTQPNGEPVAVDAQYFTSADGVAWTQGPDVPQISWLVDLERTAGVATALIGRADGSQDTVSLVDGQWRSTGLGDSLAGAVAAVQTDEEVAGVNSIVMGTSGVAANVMLAVDPYVAAEIRIEHQNYTLELRSESRWIVVDVSGAEIGSPMDRADSTAVRWGREGGVEVRDESGNVVDTFTDDEVQAASGDLFTEPTSRWLLMFSQDGGVTWSATEIDKLVGAPGAIQSMIVTDTGVVVKASVTPTSSGDPTDETIDTADASAPASTFVVFDGRLG